LIPLFVYGPLRSDGAQAGLLAGLHRDRASVRGLLYRMPNRQPAISLGGDNAIHGELVYGVPHTSLPILDMCMGVSQGARSRVQASVVCGLRTVSAQVYVHVAPASSGGRLLPKGRWRQPREG